MDVVGFLADLKDAFDGDLLGDHPVDRTFESVVSRVPGMTTEHTLTLLNLAVARMDPGESYLEVGSYRGRSLVGAMFEQHDAEAVAIESFREFGGDADAGHAELLANIKAFGCADNVRAIRGEAFRVMPRLRDRSVGVYFYDGAHSRVAQYLGLALAEPLLADTALVVVDDASWRQVDRSTRHYVQQHPGYTLVLDLAATRNDDPRWCNGVKVLSWKRPAGWVAPGGFDVAWRRVAHLWGLDPARHLAWRVLPKHPRLMALVQRAYLHGGTSVPSRGGNTPE